MSLLVIEDDPLLRRRIGAVLEKVSADVTNAGDLRAARQWAADLEFDFALLDLNLPDGCGMDLLKQRIFPPRTGIIIMTANSNLASAIEAMRLGALDYLVKPFNPAEVPLVIERARRARQSMRREEHHREETAAVDLFFGSSLAGLREQIEKILASDQRVTGTPAPVLIEGETGTGKTTIARWIHQQGPRAAQPLVEVNCSTLPETLAESELFGHERGAFTDARTARLGLFEAAGGGTLLLDELSSLTLALQAKVLTAIEDRKIRRVGGNKPIEVDVRVIAATNRNLKDLIAAGQFREDLFHRLDLFRLRLPPLRERGEDTLRLAETLLYRLSRRHRLPARRISEHGRQRLLSYPWPGNVRELAHELERALVFENAAVLEFQHLSGAAIHLTADAAASSASKDWFNDQFQFPEQGFSIEQAMMRIIHHAMNQTGGNMSAAARLLGVSRDHVRYRLEGK